MAEIEHFVHPEDRSHPKFAGVADMVLPLLSACDQMDGKPAVMVKVGDAVEKVLWNVTRLSFIIWLLISQLMCCD